MKKIGIVITVLVSLLVFGWLGITFAFSNLVEPWIDAGLEKANEEQSVAVIEKTSFEKGFFSSRTTTSITGEVINEPTEEVDEILLRHEIYHGPVAMTPGGPQFCQAYVVTTLDRSNLDDDTIRRIEDAFGEKEPVKIETWRSYGGEEKVVATIAGFSFDDDEAIAEFGGAVFRIEGNSAEERVDAEFEVSALEMNPKDEEGGFRLEPSKGKMSFEGGAYMTGTMEFGALDLSIEDETAEALSEFTLQGGNLSIDMKAPASGENLLLGTATMSFPGAEVKSPRFSGSLEDLTLQSVSSAESGAMEGEVIYSIGKLESPQLAEATSGSDTSFLYPAAFSMSYSGVDLEGAAKLSENMEKLQSSVSTGAESEADSAVLDELVEGLFQIWKPGLGAGIKLAFGNHEGTPNVLADLSLDMKGRKTVREMETWGEILNSMTVSLKAATSDPMADNQMLMPYLMQAQMMGIGKRTLGGAVTAEARVENGALLMDGKPSPLPLLKIIEPMLAEPIEWDPFIDGIKEGLKASVSGSGE